MVELRDIKGDNDCSGSVGTLRQTAWKDLSPSVCTLEVQQELPLLGTLRYAYGVLCLSKIVF